MSETENSVRLGEGVSNEVKTAINQEMTDAAKVFIGIVSKIVKEKIKDAPGKLEQLLNSKETEQELLDLWSDKLVQEGLIPKVYSGLREEHLIVNMHQDGYLGGLYAGYTLAMMGLVDNHASEELILSVRDYIRPNLIGHHYDNKDEFYSKYKDEKYSWVEKIGKSTEDKEK